jgi:hypothetical protein
MMATKAWPIETGERKEPHDYDEGRGEGERILAGDGFHCPQ